MELYEYILWNDQGLGVIIHATDLVAARNLQEAAEKAAAERQDVSLKPRNAYVSVRKWGETVPIIWHE